MLKPHDISSIPTFQKVIAEGYSLTAIYTYENEHGEILYWRVRLEHLAKEKFIRPIYQNAEGKFVIGEPKMEAKPVYGLGLLTRFPKARVWLVEGEKCADTLNAFFSASKEATSNIALTSGSATSADKADWSPFKGRIVHIWPDNGESGLGYAADIYSKLFDLGCSIQCIDSSALALGAEEDCVDWLEANSTATIADLLALPLTPPVPSEVEITCMSDIEMKPISWLWHRRMARGKLTVMAGNPGLGKSQITAWLAATVTSSLPWLDTEDKGDGGHVIFLSAEDDAADTIKPRLVAAGADISKCHILTAIKAPTKGLKASQRGFDLTEDVERLGNAIAHIGKVSMVIIDPISAYLGEIDSNSNSEMRGVLAKLATMAAQYSVSIILLTHLNKSIQQEFIGRVIGSIGLIAAARAGYAVVKDPKNPDLRYFLPIKNNIGNDVDGFAFQIEGFEVGEGIETSRIVWQDGTVDAQKILYPEEPQKPTAASEAAQFLEELLSKGPMMAQDVYDAAEGDGYTKGVINRAAKKIVHRKKLGMDEGWQWQLRVNLKLKNTEDAEGSEGNARLGEAVVTDIA